MKRTDARYYPILIILIAVALSVSVSSARAHIGKIHSDLPPLRFTILSCMDPVTTYTNFHVLAHYLESQTGREIILQVPRDYAAFRRIIRRRQTDFSYQPAHVFLDLEDFFNPETLLSGLTPSGRRLHQAFLVARSDSSIETITDLYGKSVLFGPKESTVRAFAARRLLEDNGIDIERDLHDNRYGLSCEKTAFNVFLGAYDAGFVCDHSWKVLSSGANPAWPIPPGSLKIIGKTMEIPTWIFGAMQGLEPDIAQLVADALISLSRSKSPGNSVVLRTIEAGGFAPTKLGDLLLLRDQIGAP